MEFQQNIFAFGDMCAMVLSLILPYYIEFMISLSISPIFGFGLLALGGRIAINNLVKVEIFDEKFNKKIATSNEEILKDKKIEFKENNENNYQLMVN